VTPTTTATFAARQRRPARFLVFGLAVVIGISALTARLFFLQIANGTAYTELAERNRTVDEALPSTRGLIFDRAGRPLVTNVPSFSVKVRPVDLPLSRRAEVVERLSALLGIDGADMNTTIDSNPGSRFDLVRIAQDVPRETANLIAESGLDLPGVEVIVESRREYSQGALLAQIIGYTGPVAPEQLETLRARGYLPDDLVGKAGVESMYEAQLRGSYGWEKVERDATGRRTQVLETTQVASPGSSLRLTIDTEQQRLAQQALRWAMQESGIKRGVVIAMNPQTGEIQAMVSLPTYDNNAFASGISNRDYNRLARNPDKPLLNHAVNAHYPPGSTYKLVTGTGALADNEISAETELLTRPYLTLGDTRFYDWNRAGFGLCDLDCGFGQSSDTYFYQLAGMLGIDRLGYWARQYGFGAPTGIDLPGEAVGIVPSHAWKMNAFGERIFPGETYQAGIGQGFDVVTPIQLINAYAALANGGKLLEPRVVREVIGPDGEVIEPFKPQLIRRLKASKAELREMREAARNVILYWRSYDIFNLPIVVAGKSGTAEFGQKDAQGRLPYHSWFVGFVPKNPRPTAADPDGLKAVARTDSNLVVLAFAHDSRTVGNAATEIAKYYLQLRYDLPGDYRNPERLVRGNFYEGN
jgi:penicillin-binding protein 2